MHIQAYILPTWNHTILFCNLLFFHFNNMSYSSFCWGGEAILILVNCNPAKIINSSKWKEPPNQCDLIASFCYNLED